MEAEIRGASISAVKRLCSNRPLGNTCHNSTCRSVPAAAHALSQHRVLCYSDLHSMRTVLDSFVFILTLVFILTENIKNTKQYKTDTHRQELYLSFPAHPAKAQEDLPASSTLLSLFVPQRNKEKESSPHTFQQPVSCSGFCEVELKPHSMLFNLSVLPGLWKIIYQNKYFT